jgi:ABC-2 type transport system ATP-binding protein
MSMPRLELHAIEFAYGAHAVLRGVNLALAAGELVGLVGPNGSGKSSLMRIAAGLLAPRAGLRRVDAYAFEGSRLDAQRRVGFAVEPERLPPALRGRQCLELVAHTRALDAAALDRGLALADALGLSPWLEREVGDYSLGTRQKLAVVLALLGEPPLLLLDEVLNGLDPLAAFALKQELRRRADAGAAVLLATHGLEVAERFLDRAVLLLDGRIAADWDQSALRALREQGGGLEAAVVAHLRARAAR